MGNKKKLINKGLIDLFPKDINTFYDLFAGSAIVSMNVEANKYFVNDIDYHLYELNMYDILKLHDYKLQQYVYKLVKEYNCG